MGRRQPVFNVPLSVALVLGLLVAIHLIRQVLPDEEDSWFVIAMAFIPARYSNGVAAALPGGEVSAVTSFVTHMLIHGDFTHLMFNGAWLLAFGGAVALRIGGLRFLAFSIVCGISGALLFLIVNPDLLAPVVGASGAVAGLMGGTMRFFFNAIDLGGGLVVLREAPGLVPLMSLGEALSDRRVLLATAVWFGINFLALFGFGGPAPEGGIAWEAHIGGYVAGLLLFGWFDRPARLFSAREQGPPGTPTVH